VNGWLIRCRRCGRGVQLPLEDLMGYAASGWPDCCGEGMDLYFEVARPKAKLDGEDRMSP
jgi:hypothetical protein